MKHSAALFFLLSFIMLAPLAGAISVSPSSVKLDPNGAYPQTYEFFVGNEGSEPIAIGVIVEGNLKDYISIDSFGDTVPANGRSMVTYTVNLPKNIQPGNYRSDIKAVAKSASGGVGFNIAVSHAVWFDLPFEGEHVKPSPEMTYQPTKILETVARAINDGTMNVSDANISLTVYSPNGEVLGTYSGTRTIYVGSGETVVGRLNITDPLPGEYRAVMEVGYAGQKVTGESAMVLAEEAKSAQGTTGNEAQSALTKITGSTDNTLLYALAVVVIILVAYIAVSRRGKK